MGIMSDVTFVNNFVTIVKKFPLTQGTLKLEVIYEHKWQKVVEACCRMADRYYGAQLRMWNNRYGKWCDAG